MSTENGEELYELSKRLRCKYKDLECPGVFNTWGYTQDQHGRWSETCTTKKLSCSVCPGHTVVNHRRIAVGVIAAGGDPYER